MKDLDIDWAAVGLGIIFAILILIVAAGLPPDKNACPRHKSDDDPAMEWLLNPANPLSPISPQNGAYPYP